MNLKKIIAGTAAAVIACGALALPATAATFTYTDTSATLSTNSASASNAKTPVQIKSIAFSKVSSNKIKLVWSDAKDAQIKLYRLQRYNESAGSWQTLVTKTSDGIAGNKKYVYTDTLSSSSPQQYRYRVCVNVSNTNKYEAVNGVSRFASNIKVCLDPGHFQSKNGGTYGYSEAKAMLSVATNLQTYLKAGGIDVYMTRTNDNITLGGYTNQDDGNQLNARGHAARSNNCDVFISLHTNANSENANGCDTIHQPSTLNKTVVFVNKTAYNQSSGVVVNMANRMGYNITAKNKELGIPTCSWLSARPTLYRLPSYGTDEFDVYNETLRKKGKIVFRTLTSGEDYYAVLRAAASDGVPGILIEHSFHTVPAYCKAFMNDPDVAKHYALSDARSIGGAYGFKVLKSI